jgi:hypothetical protein
LLSLLGNAQERRRIGTLAKELIAANRGSVNRLLELLDTRL